MIWSFAYCVSSVRLFCYAGISNVHINYDGEVWPCCVLGYSQPMGFLREEGYDFRKVWHSDRAAKVRKYIKDGNCACPLANQAYSNILCSPKYLLIAIKNFLKFVQRNIYLIYGCKRSEIGRSAGPARIKNIIYRVRYLQIGDRILDG